VVRAKEVLPVTIASEEWTAADLQRLQRLDAAGMSIADIAHELGRSDAAISDHLAIVRARAGSIPTPLADKATELEWNGPDEEGDVPPPTGRQADDSAAWVHSDKNS